MIISRTPLRISFLGGGSDLAVFFAREPGAVLSTTINKYIYITISKKFDRKIRASYSITEIVEHVSELKHDLIREALRRAGVHEGIEVTSISDIPSEGTGLGSSSSYIVGLLNALYTYQGHNVEAERLAHEACCIEIDCCGKPIGKQDQYIAAYGGLRFIEFKPDGSVTVNPVICNAETQKTLQENLLLLYTGFTRSADNILREQRMNSERESVRSSLRLMKKLAEQMREALCLGEVDSVGELLHQGWIEKRKLASNITNSQIDLWYDCARLHGAIGGKLLGAGGGGFFLFYAPSNRHQDIIQALPELRHVDFRFEPQGSRIIFFEETR